MLRFIGFIVVATLSVYGANAMRKDFKIQQRASAGSQQGSA